MRSQRKFVLGLAVLGTPCGSEQALVQALREELDRGGESGPHGAIHVSCGKVILSNGMKRCSVQVECDRGCGSLIEAYGEHADKLYQKAIFVQRLLNRRADDAIRNLEALKLVLSELQEKV